MIFFRIFHKLKKQRPNSSKTPKPFSIHFFIRSTNVNFSFFLKRPWNATYIIIIIRCALQCYNIKIDDIMFGIKLERYFNAVAYFF